MTVPYRWGRPTDVPGVFALGGGDWIITWSPTRVHPYAAQWLEWASRFGPVPQLEPPQDLWSYALQTQDLS